MTRTLASLCAVTLFLAASVASIAQSGTPADRVYRHGVLFTADAKSSTAAALAIRDGRIVYVGDDPGVAPFVGTKTTVIDLRGRFLMPGLVDGHMHPLEAGLKLQKCTLNYEPITVAEMQRRVQACIDKTKNQEPDAWLEVVSWFQEGMLPAGVKTSRATLDALNTRRPILVSSSFGHTTLVNSRALALQRSRSRRRILWAARSGTMPMAIPTDCSKMRPPSPFRAFYPSPLHEKTSPPQRRRSRR